MSWSLKSFKHYKTLQKCLLWVISSISEFIQITYSCSCFLFRKLCFLNSKHKAQVIKHSWVSVGAVSPPMGTGQSPIGGQWAKGPCNIYIIYMYMYIYICIICIYMSLSLPLPLSLSLSLFLFFSMHFLLEDIKFSVCKELLLPKLYLFSVLLSLFQIFKKFQSVNIE